MSLLARFDSQTLSRVGAGSSSSRGRRTPYRDLPCRRTALSVNLPLNSQQLAPSSFGPTRSSDMSFDSTALAFPPPQFDSSPLVALHLQQSVNFPSLLSSGDSSDVTRSISPPSPGSSSFMASPRAKSSDSGTARSLRLDRERRQSDLTDGRSLSSNSTSILPSTKLAMEMSSETGIPRCKNVSRNLLLPPDSER